MLSLSIVNGINECLYTLVKKVRQYNSWVSEIDIQLIKHKQKRWRRWRLIRTFCLLNILECGLSLVPKSPFLSFLRHLIYLRLLTDVYEIWFVFNIYVFCDFWLVLTYFLYIFIDLFTENVWRGGGGSSRSC